MISANEFASPNWAENMTAMLQGFGRLAFPLTGAAMPAAGANPLLEFFMAGQRAFGASLAAATTAGEGGNVGRLPAPGGELNDPFALLGRVEAGAKNPLLDAMGIPTAPYPMRSVSARRAPSKNPCAKYRRRHRA